MTMTPTIIEVSEDNLIEAEFMSAGFVDTEIKNRVYINTVGVDTFISYLNACGIITDNLRNIHSIKKVLPFSNIADIILPNIHLDVRVVFDEKMIFVPKSHYETGIVPDAYVVLKYNKYLKSMDYLGYFEPKVIDKTKENDEYYFVTPDQLEPSELIIDFIRNFEKNTPEPLTDDEILKGRELAVKVADHDFTNEEYKEFLNMLLRSDVLRDAVLEFDNFETLASNVVTSIDMSEVKFAEDAPKLVDNLDDLLTSFETPEDNSQDEEEFLRMLEEDEQPSDMPQDDLTIDDFLEESEDLEISEIPAGEVKDTVTDENELEIDDLTQFGNLEINEDNLSLELKEENLTLDEDKYMTEEDANGDSMLDNVIDAGIKIGGAVLGGAALVAGTKTIAAGAASKQAIELAGVAGEVVKDVAGGVAETAGNIANAITGAAKGIEADNTEIDDNLTVDEFDNTEIQDEDLTDFGLGDDLLSEEPKEPENTQNISVSDLEHQETDSNSDIDISNDKDGDGFESFDELGITTDDFETNDMDFDFGDSDSSLDDITDIEEDITDVPVDSEDNTENITSEQDDFSDFDEISETENENENENAETLDAEDEDLLSDENNFEDDIDNNAKESEHDDLSDFEDISQDDETETISSDLSDDISDLDFDDSDIENIEAEKIEETDNTNLENNEITENNDLEDSDVEQDTQSNDTSELTDDTEDEFDNIDADEQSEESQMIDFSEADYNEVSDETDEPVDEELVDLSSLESEDNQDSINSSVIPENFENEVQGDLVSLEDVSVAPEQEVEKSEDYELMDFDNSASDFVNENEEVNFEVTDDFSIVTDMPEFADFSNQEIGFAPNEIIITDEFLNNSVVVENSTIISNKSIKAGEIHIDINNKAQEDLILEDNHIDNLYNPSEEIADDSGLNNSVRIANQEKPKSFPLAAGLGGIALLVAIAGIIMFAMTKSQNPEQQTSEPITGEPAPQDNNYENQNPEPVANNDNVIMNDNSNAVPNAPVPNAGNQTAQQPQAQPQIQPKQIPATSYLSIKKLTWEVPDYVSFDPNFRQYFQSAGKSIKSSLSSDLLLATDYTYSNLIKVAIVFDKSGAFKQSRMVSSSGSAQVDKIVLQSLNQTLKVLKAPNSLRNDESTTVILKIYL